MTTEQKREQAISALAEILRITPFQVEYKVKKNPQGVKIIIEVSQEQMDATMEGMIERHKEK
jgi:hypothetical protein